MSQTSLLNLLNEKQELIKILEDEEGVLSEELEKFWDNNEMEISKKVDRTAFMLKSIDEAIASLKDEKKLTDGAIKGYDKLSTTLKNRLNTIFSIHQVESVKGLLCSIKRTESKRRSVDLQKLTNEDYFYNLTMDKSLFDKILAKLMDNDLIEAVLNSTEKIAKGVTQLPENHPAIETTTVPTVTVYWKKKSE